MTQDNLRSVSITDDRRGTLRREKNLRGSMRRARSGSRPCRHGRSAGACRHVYAAPGKPIGLTHDGRRVEWSRVRKGGTTRRPKTLLAIESPQCTDPAIEGHFPFACARKSWPLCHVGSSPVSRNPPPVVPGAPLEAPMLRSWRQRLAGLLRGLPRPHETSSRLVARNRAPVPSRVLNCGRAEARARVPPERRSFMSICGAAPAISHL